MIKYYTNEKNTLMLISLLKAHNIKKVVASPGHTNVSFVASIQNDPYFEIYSAVDERAAAYIACGLSAESEEPVVLSCTGATASRNYMPGLTEAFYRQLPILAVTSTQHNGKIGHYVPQVIDRTQEPNDIAKLSVQIPTISSSDDEWACNVLINKAILELKHNGFGPVHINLATNYSYDFSVKTLPVERKIDRIQYNDIFPSIGNKKVIIFVGSHEVFSKKLTDAVDKFCEKYNTAVFCDKTSNYFGKYRVEPYVFCSQDNYSTPLNECDILIHIGTVTGAYMKIKPKEVWRVNPDGEIRDTFNKLKYVFELDEKDFFETYSKVSNKESTKFYDSCINECNNVLSKLEIDNLPLSNVWTAKYLLDLLKDGSYLHLGILNSLRSYNYFPVNKKIYGYSNTGGFGIDGLIATLLGASLAQPDTIHYGVIGDLAFFYDMNTLGNRHFNNNIRLLVINNGCGTEFHNYNARGAILGEQVDNFVAAGGHFSNKSKDLIKDYSLSLGYKYIRAENKKEVLDNLTVFTSEVKYEQPIIFEIFTTPDDESAAIKMMNNLVVNKKEKIKNKLKKVVSSNLKEKVKKIVKK